jgi:glucose/arabinose dehydrogenase
MSRHTYLRLALSVLMAAFALPLAAHGPSQDSQSESVADAARRAREQKKAAAKPTPVVTDDTLKPAAPAGAQATPDANAPAGDSAAVPGGAPGAATPEDPEKRAKDTQELASLKQQLAEAQKGLDLLQRDFALQQDNYFSNASHDRDLAGKAKLDDMKQQILDKQKEFDALKARLASLQESVGTPDPAPATPPPSSPHF